MSVLSKGLSLQQPRYFQPGTLTTAGDPSRVGGFERVVYEEFVVEFDEMSRVAEEPIEANLFASYRPSTF